ncbi:MAG: hypothetical protein K8J09_01050 [Planctomycetes bacterium]|nr:hypothetical protein [Planctomycetota bacterium]MCC7397837.1 hypothetical protein [Planctomycetota bacterium]
MVADLRSMGSWLLALGASMALPAQSPAAAVEVISGPGTPEQLLGDHSGRAEFVVCDISLVVRDLVGVCFPQALDQGEFMIWCALQGGSTAAHLRGGQPLRSLLGQDLDSGEHVLNALLGPADCAWRASGARRLLEPMRAAGCDDRPWRSLHDLLVSTPASPAESVREAVVQAMHELVVAAPDDELLNPLGLAFWRTKWFDAAAFGYVGLCDPGGLLLPSSEPRVPRRPQLVIEPLPGVLRALRVAYARLVDIDGSLQVPSRASLGLQCIDDMLTMLDAQGRGQEAPREVRARLWRWMLQDVQLEVAESGGAVDRSHVWPLRCSGLYLVRLPIRWRGETRMALAFRHWVECGDQSGAWSLPPWGLLLKDGLPQWRR